MRAARRAARLVLEDAPYQRLKDGFKQVEDEAEDQQEDQVDEEDTGNDDPDEQPFGEPLHVETNHLNQQGGHQQTKGGADRIREPQQRADRDGQVAGILGDAVRYERSARWRGGDGSGRNAAKPTLALAARLVLR